MKAVKSGIAVCITLALMLSVSASAIGAQPDPGVTLTNLGLSDDGMFVKVKAVSWKIWAGEALLEDPDGALYEAYCIDYGVVLLTGDMLIADSGLDTYLSDESAAKVNFILNMYKTEDAANPDLEAAGIQCAIWAVVTSEWATPFLSDPIDGYNITWGNAIRDRAFAILASIPEPAVYPVSIALEPDWQALDTGETATLTATVLDQLGMPFEGASVSFETTAGTLSDTVVITGANGEAEVTLSPDGATSATVTATTNGGESRLIWDGLTPVVDKQNLAVPPEEISDCAAVEWCCYYPKGYTPGFWKNNVGKQIGMVNGKGIQVPLSQIITYLNNIDTQFGDAYDLDFLKFTGSNYEKALKAYNILKLPDNSDNMELKAQKMILALLLTIQWQGADYLNGCVDMPIGDDMTIADAMDDILHWYTHNNFTAAKNLADWINNQPEGGY
ncbi:MAG: Ig-like domain-containing protein [Methanomassiliicoccales archaeon]|nr:Ig-like domain-containing protein [Methanomassiliicoccales archaeon]